MFDHYAFCACEDGTRAPQAVGDRHDLKGERERMFSPLLADLDLHHPPCLSLGANQAFYTLAALANHLLTLPTKLSRQARGLVLRLYCPAGWLDWWRLWRERAGAPA